MAVMPWQSLLTTADSQDTNLVLMFESTARKANVREREAMNTQLTQLADRFTNRRLAHGSQPSRFPRQLLVLLMAFATGAGACSKTDGAGTGTGVAAENTSNRVQDQKLQAAIKGINFVSSKLYRVRRAYMSRVDPDVGPDETTSFSFSRFSETSTIEAMDEAIAARPADPKLDPAMTAYVIAVKELEPHLNAASTYYGNKSNKDDAAAKGKELHPKLVAGFTEFALRAKELTEVVDEISRAKRVAKLAILEADPSARHRYLSSKVMLVAEDAVKLGDVPLEELDLEALTATASELDAAIAQIDEYAAAGTQPTMSLGPWRTSLTHYAKAVHALARRKREGKGFTERELKSLETRSVEGSAKELVTRYNELIDMSNIRN